MSRKLETALISIYDAANDSDGWNSSLDACVDYVDARSANIMFQENSVNSRWRYSLGSQLWRSCTPEQVEISISMFEKYDTRAWEFVHKHRKQTLLVDTDFWKDVVELDKREDYQFFQNQLGFTRKVGSKLNDNLSWTDNIAFQFPKNMQTVPEENLQRIRNLLPHAAKSIELWRTFSILKSQYKAVLSALDHVRVGLCVADPSGAIVISNDEANKIFEQSGAIRLGKDRQLHCRSPEVEHSIRQAIKNSCATSSGKASFVEALQVLGDDSDTQISVEVVPLRDSGAEIAADFHGALITLIDFSADLKIDSAKLSSAYRLTPTEAEVCEMLVKGTSAGAIAEIREVRSETVKTQLKSIYRKTACKNRVELTRLALKVSPPISPPA